MPSKPNNIIGNLRRRYEPHMQLEAKVDLNHSIIHKIDGKLGDLPKIHATLSKSFGLQRKTLKRLIELEKKVDDIPRGITTIKGEKGDRGETGRRGPKGGLRGRIRWPGEPKVTTGRGRGTSGPGGDWEDKVSGDWDGTSGSGGRDGAAGRPVSMLDGPGAFDRGGASDTSDTSDKLPDKSQNPDISGIFDGTDDVDVASGLDEVDRQRQIDDKVEEIRDTQEKIEEVLDDTLDEVEERGEEIPEGLDDLIDDVRTDVDDAAATSGSAKKKPRVIKRPFFAGGDWKRKKSKKKPKKKPVARKIPKKKPVGKKKRISTEDLKKGTSLKYDDFGSRVHGIDEEGEYLTGEERKIRFNKRKIKPGDIRGGSGI